MDKLKTFTEIGKICNQIRERRIIVSTNGAFDVLHPGHIISLQMAKSYGDYLVVGLNSDMSVKRYKPGRPIFNQNDRAIMLSALECVDAVVIFEEDDPRNLLEVIRPRYHIKSKTGFKGIERETLQRNGGEIVLIDDLTGYSTTEVLKKLGI